jgi:acetylornithine/succinyldiaminopimelate/putrescine aminotransferase
MAQPANVVDSNIHLTRLREMRRHGGSVQTTGIDDDVIVRFLAGRDDLSTAIEQAYAHFEGLRKSRPELLALDEADQVVAIQQGIVNFYATDAINPYVAAGAKGPWIVTLKGAVIYDCGGYGMLGLGHAPDVVLEAMNQPHVMANIMTPAVSQLDFIERLREEIGHTRKGGSPFSHYLCLNSGSESVSIGARLADVNAKEMTAEGGRYAGMPVRGLTLKGSFHGRTDRPAQFSDSSIGSYRKYLRSFDDHRHLLTVEPNNIAELDAVFQQATDEGFFIEAFFMEPVMGEGDPGQAITPEFYARARQLTADSGTLFLVDSIQAGLRTHGVLSIVDYPGFSELPGPDMETYSKALNAGQYPLSVLAMAERAAHLYRNGIYGNTMTSNPRALDIAVAVLDNFSKDIRQNICDRGDELISKFSAMADELGDAVTKVQGTGLLLSCELNERYQCYGAGSTEEYLRKKGLGVIHGGTNSLRYTPTFVMSSAEVDLIVALTRDALENGPNSN